MTTPYEEWWKKIESDPDYMGGDWGYKQSVRMHFLGTVSSLPEPPPSTEIKRLIGMMHPAREAKLPESPVFKGLELGDPYSPKQVLESVKVGALHTIPYAKYLQKEEREKFLDLPTPQQSADLTNEMLHAELYLGGGYVLKGLGWVGKHMLKNTLGHPKIWKPLINWAKNTPIGQAVVRADHALVTQEAKALLTRHITGVQAETYVKAGQLATLAEKGGIKGLSKVESDLARDLASGVGKDQLTDMLAKGVQVAGMSRESAMRALRAAHTWAQIREMIAKEAMDAGVLVRLPGGEYVPFAERMVENYIPRILKPQVKKKVFGDVQKLHEVVIGLRGKGVAEEELVEQALRLFEQQGGKFSKLTERGIRHVMGVLKVRRPEALQKMLTTFDDLGQPSFYGHLERPRLAPPLPKDFYVDDFQALVMDYIVGSSKRIAEVRSWGPKGELITKLHEAIPNVNDQRIVKDLIYAFGRGKMQGAPPPRAYKAIMETYIPISVLMRIGFGTATIPNAAQLFISAFAEAGYTRGARGVARMLFSRAEREYVKNTGVNIQHDAIKLLAGYDIGGFWKAASDKFLDLNLFMPMNRLNNSISAAVGKVFVQDLAKIYKGTAPSSYIPIFGKARVKWASDYLGRLGVDKSLIGPAGQVPNNELLKGMYNFASKAQLQRRLAEEPLLMNNPWTRPLYLFKRFGLKQLLYAKDIALKEAYRNPLPLLRLAAGGYLGGEFTVQGRWLAGEFARYVASGGRDNVRWVKEREHLSAFQRILENYAAMGTLGLLTDIGWPSREPGTDIERLPTTGDIAQRAMFTATPVQVRDVTEALNQFGYATKAEGPGELVSRLGRALLKQAPLGREALREVP